MHLTNAVFAEIAGMQQALGRRVSPTATSLEGAARALVDSVYEPLAEALVLARVFAIVPYGLLPPCEATHARGVASAASAAGQQPDERAPVLMLMASRGSRGEWNDRRLSQHHRAIPLASPSFVSSSPMIASLLDDLGVRVASVGCQPRLVGGARETPDHPTFYIADARTSVDARGRFKVPARSFVIENDVRSVFGVGGALVRGSLFVMVLFARQHVTRTVAEQLVPLASDFRASAQAVVTRGSLFKPSSV